VLDPRSVVPADPATIRAAGVRGGPSAGAAHGSEAAPWLNHPAWPSRASVFCLKKTYFVRRDPWWHARVNPCAGRFVTSSTHLSDGGNPIRFFFFFFLFFPWPRRRRLVCSPRVPRGEGSTLFHSFLSLFRNAGARPGAREEITAPMATPAWWAPDELVGAVLERRSLREVRPTRAEKKRKTIRKTCLPIPLPVFQRARRDPQRRAVHLTLSASRKKRKSSGSGPRGQPGPARPLSRCSPSLAGSAPGSTGRPPGRHRKMGSRSWCGRAYLS